MPRFQLFKEIRASRPMRFSPFFKKQTKSTKQQRGCHFLWGHVEHLDRSTAVERPDWSWLSLVISLESIQRHPTASSLYVFKTICDQCYLGLCSVICCPPHALIFNLQPRECETSRKKNKIVTRGSDFSHEMSVPCVYSQKRVC